MKLNPTSFPEDFMFELDDKELDGTSRWGGRRYRPYAFTNMVPD